MGFWSTGIAKCCCARTKSQIKNLCLCVWEIGGLQSSLVRWATVSQCLYESDITLLPTVRSTLLKHEDYLHIHKTRIFTLLQELSRAEISLEKHAGLRDIFTANIARSGHIYIFRWQNVLWFVLENAFLKADFVHGGTHAICTMRGNKSEYLKCFQKYIWHGFGVKTSFMVGKYYFCWRTTLNVYIMRLSEEKQRIATTTILVHIWVGGKLILSCYDM